MRFTGRGLSLMGALGAVCAALSFVIADEGGTSAKNSAPLHPLFELDDSEVKAAIALGEEAVKKDRTIEELLKQWAKPVPNANGYVIPMTPTVLIASAAFDAAKYHKDNATKEKQVEAARQRGREYLAFRVVLRSRGSGTWLFPGGMKPGDRQALEAIKFVLADDKEHFFQPLDPEAAKRINQQNVTVGLPLYSQGLYIPLGRTYLNLPIPLGGTRQDFEAHYEPTFALRDAQGNPILTEHNKSFSLRIIGHRGEKSMEFSLAELMPKAKR